MCTTVSMKSVGEKQLLGQALESQLQERKTRREIFLTLSLIETKIWP
jgi:hypothetical protein